MDQKIIFVGVGPGDPDLLTIKALKTIESAEPEMLGHAFDQDPNDHFRFGWSVAYKK